MTLVGDKGPPPSPKETRRDPCPTLRITFPSDHEHLEPDACLMVSRLKAKNAWRPEPKAQETLCHCMPASLLRQMCHMHSFPGRTCSKRRSGWELVSAYKHILKIKMMHRQCLKSYLCFTQPMQFHTILSITAHALTAACPVHWNVPEKCYQLALKRQNCLQ